MREQLQTMRCASWNSMPSHSFLFSHVSVFKNTFSDIDVYWSYSFFSNVSILKIIFSDLGEYWAYFCLQNLSSLRFSFIIFNFSILRITFSDILAQFFVFKCFNSENNLFRHRGILGIFLSSKPFKYEILFRHSDNWPHLVNKDYPGFTITDKITCLNNLRPLISRNQNFNPKFSNSEFLYRHWTIFIYLLLLLLLLPRKFKYLV